MESFTNLNIKPMRYLYIKVNGKSALNLNEIKVYIREGKTIKNIALAANFVTDPTRISNRNWYANITKNDKGQNSKVSYTDEKTINTYFDSNTYSPSNFVDNNRNTTGHSNKEHLTDNLLITLNGYFPISYLNHIYILNRQSCCKDRFPKVLEEIQILDDNKNVISSINPTIPQYDYNAFIFYNLGYYFCLNNYYFKNGDDYPNDTPYTYTIDPTGKTKTNNQDIYVSYYFPINSNIYKSIENITGDTVTPVKVSGAVNGGHDKYTFRISPNDIGNMNFYYYSSEKLKNYQFQFYFTYKGKKINLKASNEKYISNENMYRYTFKLNPNYKNCNQINNDIFGKEDDTFYQGFMFNS